MPVDRRSIVVVVLALLLGVLLAACGGDGDGDETGATGENPATTVSTQGAEDGAEGDAAAGKDVFASAGCGSCHVFEAAGSNGTAGPNLDEADPSFDEAVEQITNGGGGMPAFGDQLSKEAIRNVAAFVVESGSD